MTVLPRWLIALLAYMLIVTLLLASKPALLFHADGGIKTAGTGLMYGESPFSPSIAFPLLAIICYVFSGLFSLAFV